MGLLLLLFLIIGNKKKTKKSRQKFIVHILCWFIDGSYNSGIFRRLRNIKKLGDLSGFCEAKSFRIKRTIEKIFNWHISGTIPNLMDICNISKSGKTIKIILWTNCCIWNKKSGRYLSTKKTAEECTNMKSFIIKNQISILLWDPNSRITLNQFYFCYINIQINYICHSLWNSI